MKQSIYVDVTQMRFKAISRLFNTKQYRGMTFQNALAWLSNIIATDKDGNLARQLETFRGQMILNEISIDMMNKLN